MSKIKVLFICHGNICRSPMAEFVMKDLVKKAGLSDQFEIASAATSREENWKSCSSWNQKQIKTIWYFHGWKMCDSDDERGLSCL